MKAYKESWVEKRLLIKNSYSLNNQWIFVINDIFKSRIEDYYFNPIESIIKTRWWKWEWFSIVGLECILIETIWAFEEWLIFNYSKWSNWPSYEYTSSETIFTKYFSKYFSNFFDTSKSKLFFREVRCWILHEWRAKNLWKIRTRYGAMINQKTDETIVNFSDSGYLIYRNNLFFSIKRNFELYIQALLENNSHWEELRKNLWRKLDHMFDILESERNWFDWWNQS